MVILVIIMFMHGNHYGNHGNHHGRHINNPRNHGNNHGYHHGNHHYDLCVLAPRAVAGIYLGYLPGYIGVYTNCIQYLP